MGSGGLEGWGWQWRVYGRLQPMCVRVRVCLSDTVPPDPRTCPHFKNPITQLAHSKSLGLQWGLQRALQKFSYLVYRSLRLHVFLFFCTKWWGM